MKQGLLLNIHSVVDTITNSSTELFLGKTEKSLEVVNEILFDYISMYYKHNPEDEDYKKFDGTLDSILSVELIEESNVKSFAEHILNYSTPWWFKLKGERPRYDYKNYDEYNKKYEEWFDENKDEIHSQLIGCIKIEGSTDNSIPSELFDLIENIFEENSERIHCG